MGVLVWFEGGPLQNKWIKGRGGGGAKIKGGSDEKNYTKKG